MNNKDFFIFRITVLLYRKKSHKNLTAVSLRVFSGSNYPCISIALEIVEDNLTQHLYPDRCDSVITHLLQMVI
ncbi:hypothetical protein ATC1_13945 [Flexilinea flocculi]|uniref:Uncharacterized protein n=1 Tax=Flexilinea flocculi TaxID=1678840 RepID=A0A0S7BWR5_9CHLR|nr:hypothetical protein ATC1_13945 [Flexilinea flocculi]